MPLPLIFLKKNLDIFFLFPNESHLATSQPKAAGAFNTCIANTIFAMLGNVICFGTFLLEMICGNIAITKIAIRRYGRIIVLI